MRLAIESLATYKPLAADMTTLLAIGRASIGAWKAKEAAARVRAILYRLNKIVDFYNS